MSDILVVPPVSDTPVIGITSEGQKEKSHLMIVALGVQKIETNERRDYAIEASGQIQAHLKAVESARQEVLKPFHAVVKAINRAAADHVMDLESEKKRLNGIIGLYEQQRQKEDQLRQMEIAAKASEATQVLEELPKNPPASPDDRARTLEATLEAEERIEALSQQIVEHQAQVGTQKAKGGALRKDWDITVTDIKALYAAHPQCVELTARTLAIKDLLKVGITPAGVTATPKVAYAARASK